MITQSQIENAMAVLKSGPDGSTANAQAIRQARIILMSHVESLTAFIQLNPMSKSALAVMHTCKQIMDTVNASYPEVC